MRTSLKWIKDLVPGIEDLTPQEYLDAMTLSGSKGEYYVELDKISRILRTDFKNRKAS